MQSDNSTPTPEGVKLKLKLAAWPLTNPDYLFPPLRIGKCCRCGADTLAVELRQHAGLWAATMEPSLPWIRIGIPLAEFIDVTNVRGAHACDRESAVTQ